MLLQARSTHEAKPRSRWHLAPDLLRFWQSKRALPRDGETTHIPSQPAPRLRVFRSPLSRYMVVSLHDEAVVGQPLVAVHDEIGSVSALRALQSRRPFFDDVRRF
jgi:hypothetical protein